MSEKESMERMNNHALDLVRAASEQGGNLRKARIAQTIIEERMKDGTGSDPKEQSLN